MSYRWDSDAPPPPMGPFGFWDWVRIVLRTVTLVTVIVVNLAIMMGVRLVERLFVGARRPVSAFFPKFVSRIALAIMGLRVRRIGSPMQGVGAVVANHSTWVDIFVLNAQERVSFVAKSEVAGWPGIGHLARASGTVFVKRDRRAANAQTKLFLERLELGQKLLFFPEGTSTDGLSVLNFRPTLFEAFFGDEVVKIAQIQPVSVIYRAPEGKDPRFYGWFGDMGFGPHMLSVLSARRPGLVTLVYHDPVAVADFDGRKALAGYCEHQVRAGFTAHLA